MYVTRPLSDYIRHPESLSTSPEGPNSGYLVLQDEESETVTCFGLYKSRYLLFLPFPQDKNLTIRYATGTADSTNVSHDQAILIPVLNQPLSSNRYYAIKPHGSHKGEAYACSLEENINSACCSCCIQDEYPRPLDPNDVYQHFQIVPYKSFFSSTGRFTALSVAPDGIPPYFLRRKGWEIYRKTPNKFELGEALGVNSTFRAQLPTFDFPVKFQNSAARVVGKWYCPFMFISDGTLKEQINNSMYYEMTLEQSWEKIFACENNHDRGNFVNVDVEIEKEVVSVRGREALWDENNVVNGVIWFRSITNAGEEDKIGLSSLIFDRMKWEVTRFGWVKSKNRRERVEKTEEFRGIGDNWRSFGCYVLVERFTLKRNNGRVALTYDFKHTQVVRSKWE